VLSFLRTLSNRVEFAIVIAVAFGYFILTSIIIALHPAPEAHISEAHLQGLIIYELPVLIALLLFLHLRGWTLARVGLRPSVEDTLVGLGLLVAAYAGAEALWMVVQAIFPEAVRAAADVHLVAPGFALITVLLACALNAVFEELFVCAYVISSLKGAVSPWSAINTSVAIRLLYHLYQGSLAISVIAFGLVFAYWYARTGRAWPLIVAHGAADLLGLAAYISD
jgi:membrane protease YdiL (CAAX protease family)